MTNTNAAIESVLNSNRDYLLGGELVEEAALDWANAGFTADQVDAWVTAGAFDAARTKELVGAGITPKEGAQRHSSGGTLASYHSNNDLSVGDIKRLLSGVDSDDSDDGDWWNDEDDYLDEDELAECGAEHRLTLMEHQCRASENRAF